jgi:hypothetical protein
VPTHDVLEVYTASIQRDRDRLALLLTVARTALAQIACKTGERRTSEYAEEALKALDASEGKEPLLSKQLRSGEMVKAKDMEK